MQKKLLMIRKGLGFKMEEQKTVSTWEMIKALMENPKRKAETVGSRFNEIVCSVGHSLYFELKNIKAKNDELEETEFNGNVSLNDKWTIIEPPKKLKEMTFGEAIYYWSNIDDIKNKDIISCVSGETLEKRNWRQISKDEYLGLWTVEGVFEDE